MSMIGYRSENHPQQTALRGALDEVDDRGTKWEFIHELEARFGAPFTLDVAAAAHNAKARRYYTREADGLAQPWDSPRIWCNPPYSRVPGVSDLGSWVRKAWEEWPLRPTLGRPERIVMLVPANRVEQAWWQDHVEPYRDRLGSPLRVEFQRGRMRFDQPAHWVRPEKGDRPPFGLALLIWEHPSDVSPPRADPICNERGVPQSECPAHCLHGRRNPPAATCPSGCGRNEPCPDPWHDCRVVIPPGSTSGGEPS